jgi:hypothetical protein
MICIVFAKLLQTQNQGKENSGFKETSMFVQTLIENQRLDW